MKYIAASICLSLLIAFPVFANQSDIEIIMQKAETGDPAFQYQAGNFYFEGNHLPQDYSKAFEMYDAAAKQGFIPAIAALGKMYEKGEGVPRNMAKALQSWETAALSPIPKGITPQFWQNVFEGEILQAQYALALLYTAGIKSELEHDYVKAYVWANIAISHDFTKVDSGDSMDMMGHAMLEILKEKMTKEETKQAEKWLKEYQKNPDKWRANYKKYGE